MLTLRIHPRSEGGFTLVETLVTMVVGLAVISTLLMLLEFTYRDSSRIVTAIDADSAARVQLTGLEQELQSACLTSGVTPLQSGSTDTTLRFISAYGKVAQPTPIEHVVSYTAATGALTESLYAANGGAAPNWTFSATPYATTSLLSNARPSGTTPMFQYFAYQQVPNGSGGYYTDAGGNAYMMLLDGTSSVPGTTPAVIPAKSPLAATAPAGLSATDAGNAVEVLISMSVGGSGGTMEETGISDTRVTTTDSIVLRLTPPPDTAASGATFGPCQ